MGAFKYEDLIEARRRFANQDRAESMVAVLNPDDYTDLLLDSRFVDVSQYGEREPILNGEVGKAAGFKILETTRIPSGTVLYVNTLRAGWLVQKRSLDIKPKEVQELDAYKWYLYRELAPKMTDDYSVQISVNHAANSEDI